MADLNPEELVPIDDRDQLLSVLTAVSQFRENPQISHLIDDAVSQYSGDGNAEIQAVEATPEGVFQVRKTNKFEAVANVYVIFHSGKTVGSLAMSDTLPAYVFGHFSDGNVVIDQVSVDHPEAEEPGGR
jgi:hypothetical protein